MKKLLLLLFCLPLLFTTCKKEEDNTPTNNTGNDTNTFLSNNDGSVFVCQDCSRGSFTLVVSGNRHADSLIGFYNATNFLYQRWKVNDTIPCTYYFEGPWGDFPGQPNGSRIQIITNTPNEFVFSEFVTLGGEEVAILTRRFTGSDNQITSDIIGTDQNGQFISYGARTYIRSTMMDNLSCN